MSSNYSVVIAPASSTSTHNNNNSSVKTEKGKSALGNQSNEYDDWAQKLVNRPIPQLTNNSSSSGGTLLFQSVNNSGTSGSGASSNTSHGGASGTMLIGGDGLPPHQGFDIDSAIGRFTWITVDEDKYIPALFRSGETFACVRMMEVSVINGYNGLLPQEIYDAVKLNSHFSTSAEAKLLNYINSFHCDGLYGSSPFTTQDLLVSTSEMEKFYWYLTFAYDVLGSGGRNKTNDFRNCGFVEVNKSMIPYAVLEPGDDGASGITQIEKAVPLFYFEGQVDILKNKAHVLRGWKLAYLKICCRVQGVRKDLITPDELLIVHLSDLKSYFPKRTVFTENSWPTPRVSKSLLLKPGGLGGGNGVYHHQQNHHQSSPSSSNRWTRPLGNDGYFSTQKSNSQTLTARTINITNLGSGGTGTAPRATATIPPLTRAPPSQNQPPMDQQQYTIQQRQASALQALQRQAQLQPSVASYLIRTTASGIGAAGGAHYAQSHGGPNSSAASKYIQNLQNGVSTAPRIAAHPYANTNLNYGHTGVGGHHGTHMRR